MRTQQFPKHKVRFQHRLVSTDSAVSKLDIKQGAAPNAVEELPIPVAIQTVLCEALRAGRCLPFGNDPQLSDKLTELVEYSVLLAFDS